jgi:hypothetical protein
MPASREPGGRRARLAGMTVRPAHSLAALFLGFAMVLGGCAQAAPVHADPSPGLDPTVPPLERIEPDVPPDGQVPGGPQVPDRPQLVVPVPGQAEIHPVSVRKLVAQVEGRRVLLNAHWESGVEPCSVLDSVRVGREGSSITVTLLEGSGNPDAMCIMIAVSKVTVIDLGILETGTYTIRADPGDAAPLTVIVP